jgi:hypothetical protein
LVNFYIHQITIEHQKIFPKSNMKRDALKNQKIRFLFTNKLNLNQNKGNFQGLLKMLKIPLRSYSRKQSIKQYSTEEQEKDIVNQINKLKEMSSVPKKNFYFEIEKIKKEQGEINKDGYVSPARKKLNLKLIQNKDKIKSKLKLNLITQTINQETLEKYCNTEECDLNSRKRSLSNFFSKSNFNKTVTGKNNFYSNPQNNSNLFQNFQKDKGQKLLQVVDRNKFHSFSKKTTYNNTIIKDERLEAKSRNIGTSKRRFTLNNISINNSSVQNTLSPNNFKSQYDTTFLRDKPRQSLINEQKNLRKINLKQNPHKPRVNITFNTFTKTDFYY